ncbi:MAG: hypothetical protein K1X83_09370 [Oligoflexia bacterium]|nr:hypothetical protein [Oligoflexia bacterium]
MDDFTFPIAVVAALLAALLLMPIIKWLAWKLFHFDQKVERIISQTKSSEVRLGKTAETLAPLLENFPVDVRKAGTSTVFIGQPVDFIHFDPDIGITFIEVKSGNSKLSLSQRKLKELIDNGQVEWVQFQVR